MLIVCCWIGITSDRVSAQSTAFNPDGHAPVSSLPPDSRLPPIDGPQLGPAPGPEPLPMPSAPGVDPSQAVPETNSRLPQPTDSPEQMWEWSTWFSPEHWYEWLGGPAWTGSAEIGINGTAGNSDALSSRFGGNLKRKTELWEFKGDFLYTKATSDGRESQHNAIANAGYERYFPETPWSHFGRYFMEYNEFKAFDLRIALNTGMGYQFVKTDRTNLKGRFGAGVSHEIDSPDERWAPEAVFGGDWTHDPTPRQKFALTSDFFPEWGDFSSYRLVSNGSWTIALDEASKMSLKMSVNDLYDSTPNGRKPHDVIYALLLIWQL
jgi:putative salt-induced outer membrane protein YdiY